VDTQYPYDGQVVVAVAPEAGDPEAAETFTLRLRLPGWCKQYRLALNGAALEVSADALGWLVLRRAWTAGDQVALSMEMPVNAVVDTIGNMGHVAITRGPLVFAADAGYLPAGSLLDDVILSLDGKDPGSAIRVVKHENGTVHLVARRAILRQQTGEGFWREKERYEVLTSCAVQETVQEIELVPFVVAGNKQFKVVEGIRPNDEPVRSITFQVWLPFRCE
jgi:DUF1680 family protein